MEIINKGILAKSSPFFHADYTSASGGNLLDAVESNSNNAPMDLLDMIIPFIIIAGFIIGFVILYNYVIKAKK